MCHPAGCLGDNDDSQLKEVTGPISSQGCSCVAARCPGRCLDGGSIPAQQNIPQMLPAPSRALSVVGPVLCWGVTSGMGTPLGHVGLPSGCPGAGVLPTSHPPGYLCWNLGRCWEHPAARSREGWNPSEYPHLSPHPLGTPWRPCPPSIALAVASPSPSCCSPSWLGDPAWGQLARWGGLRAKPCPPQPLCPHRGAWPGGAPCPVLEGVWQALGCSVPRSTHGCSTFAALSHLTPQSGTHWGVLIPPASSGGAGSRARSPGGISPVAPHPSLHRDSAHALPLASSMCQ